jgi:hypothetical protein
MKYRAKKSDLPDEGGRQHAPAIESPDLIPIMIRLERPFLLDADILRLVLAQLRQLDADLGQAGSRREDRIRRTRRSGLGMSWRKKRGVSDFGLHRANARKERMDDPMCKGAALRDHPKERPAARTRSHPNLKTFARRCIGNRRTAANEWIKKRQAAPPRHKKPARRRHRTGMTRCSVKDGYRFRAVPCRSCSRSTSFARLSQPFQ